LPCLHYKDFRKLVKTCNKKRKKPSKKSGKNKDSKTSKNPLYKFAISALQDFHKNFQSPLTTLKAKAPYLTRCGAFALLAWQDSNTRHPQGGVGGECRWHEPTLRRADTSAREAHRAAGGG